MIDIRELQEAYEKGTPIVPDSVYDALSLHDNCAIGPEGTFAHIFRMYSLNKSYDEHPSFSFPTVETPKLDGIAVALVYINGEFNRAITRGDGIRGVEVSTNIRALCDIPESYEIWRSVPVVQINCEVVAGVREDNVRNIVAGAVNEKIPNLNKASEYKIQAIPYDCSAFTRGSWRMQMLAAFPKSVLTVSAEVFPTDGTVVRVDDIGECKKLGYTNKYPRFAYAKKVRGERVQTTLRDIRWQLGKGGKLTPVAIFDEVEIDGARISRATLHNVKYVIDTKFWPGDQIILERSGGIIPHVVCKIS